MEALTRLVTESLARHGFNRPVDPRRLQWSRWFLCDSPHSLLVVPSKPGIFAMAEEVLNLSPSSIQAGTAALGCPGSGPDGIFRGAAPQHRGSESDGGSASGAEGKRMLAVLRFSEDDDMAFVLDRMFTRPNPVRELLCSGRCFLRYVIIEDEDQRRSICNALNQWLLCSAEKASGIPAGFSSSLELTRADRTSTPTAEGALYPASRLGSGSSRNLDRPHPLPSGF